MSEPKRPPGEVLHVEDFDAALNQLLELARQQGEAIRSSNVGVVYRRARKPDIAPLLREDLRAALEDEIVPAAPQGGTGVIMEWELQQEVIKKALVGLKVPVLRQIAREGGLDASGGRENLATQIGRYYRWNEEEIARLLLENEDEPRPESGRADRLFPMASQPDLAYVANRLEYVLNRYIRIGIARWFVFETMGVSDGEVRLTGSVRSYQADIDETGEEPSLSARATDRRVIAYLRADDAFLQIEGASILDARACARALTIAAKLEMLGYVPTRPAEGVNPRFDPTALFLLDLIAHRLPEVGLRRLDLTVARFRIGDESEDDEDATPRPTLKAVRFEGRHLLDSAPACKLLAEESRPLIDVSLRVDSPARPDGETIRVPIRIALEGDHAVAMTSYGAAPTLSRLVHTSVLAALKAEIAEGFLSPEKLMVLCERIAERAVEVAPNRADMLMDPDDA